MKNSLIIRDAAAHKRDAEFIVTSQLAMALETEKMVLNEETVTKGVWAVLQDETKGRYYLVEKEQQLVACMLTIPEWSDWRNATVLWIHSLYVMPGFRGQGIYSRLYSHLQKKVQDSSAYRGIRLYVDKTNTQAQVIYKKLGMDNQHYELFEWMK